MDLLIHGRATPTADDCDIPGLDEAHWTYMDAYAARMTARGPTLSPDRASWTGSLHVLDLDSSLDARTFALRDPYHRAGMFQDHLIRRFDNLLGRTMWDVTPRPGEVPFLILADVEGPPPSRDALDAGLPPELLAQLVLWGTLARVDASAGQALVPSGMALALLATDEAAARSVLAAHPVLLAGSRLWQLHAWEFGGRR